LVSQSLICFRYCLEALRAKRAGLLETRCHESCGPAWTYECLTDLISNVSLYLDELSRVFFLKENMRGKTTWWLSVFYSFCIQSFVRNTLIELEKVIIWPSFAIREYLRLPIRLFIASSGSYDPLCEVPTSTSDGEPRSNDYREVQLAVGQSKWSSEGINGSGDYLQRLFEDDSTFSNWLRHVREKSGAAKKLTCPNCGAEFTRTTLRMSHLATCNAISSKSGGSLK